MIALIMPPNTPPVTPSNVIIAQFIPWDAGALGSPKQVAHASAVSGTNNKMNKRRICYQIFPLFALLFISVSGVRG